MQIRHRIGPDAEGKARRREVSVEWISVKDKLPEALYGCEGEPPCISEDVAVYFEDVCVDIANYDHEAKHWSLPNRSFNQPDIDPTHWCRLPEMPEATSAQKLR